jgi:thiamine biosynthesis protein ThiS
MAQEIEVRLNGEKRRLPEGLSLLDLLERLELRADRVAIELNREIVKRERWEGTLVGPGDAIEIVHFVGGGSNRLWTTH